MKMNADFMDKLGRLRLAFGYPMVVTSAYRCPEHDKRVSTSARAGNGPHTWGHAIDVNVWGERALFYIKKAQELGLFSGFGIHQKGEARQRFIHLDDLTTMEAGAPRPNLWTY
jgi:uncharacterized protein YcbK (DUF882 family)